MPPPAPERLPRYRTNDRDLDRRLVEILDEVGVANNRDQLFEILVTAVRLAGDDADRLDLKITNAALKELRYAFKVFAPYKDIPKVTMFGSARTLPDDPLYAQARAARPPGSGPSRPSIRLRGGPDDAGSGRCRSAGSATRSRTRTRAGSPCRRPRSRLPRAGRRRLRSGWARARRRAPSRT